MKEAGSLRRVQLHFCNFRSGRRADDEGIKTWDNVRPERAREHEKQKRCTFADGNGIAEGVGEWKPRCAQLTPRPLRFIIITVPGCGVAGVVLIPAQPVNAMVK